MRRRSRAGGKSPNAQAPKAAARKFRLEGQVYRFAAGYSLDPAYLARIMQRK
jgi:hypothetical protein